jgi:hypothetical protein
MVFLLARQWLGAVAQVEPSTPADEDQSRGRETDRFT